MSYVICDGGYLAVYELFATKEEAEARRPSWCSVREATWRQREEVRLFGGTYTQLPWDLASWTNHYAHVSAVDPNMIAFTENDEKGERDIQTRMRPGRYLAKYYPTLTPQQVEAYVHWFRTGQQPPPPDHGPLTITRDFVGVYNLPGGPGSCMAGKDCVRVYDAGDLQIAHVAHHSRAIVWPDRKVWGRVYAHTVDGERDLTCKLRDLGYKPIEESDEGFNGARILKIEEHGTFVMPYVDRCYGVDDAGDHFVLNDCDPEYGCGNTSGYLGEPIPIITCGDCGEQVPEDEARWVYRTWPNGGEVLVCQHCCETRYQDTDYGMIPNGIPTTPSVHGLAPTEALATYYVETPQGWAMHHTTMLRQDGTRIYRYGTFICPETGWEDSFAWGQEVDGVFYHSRSDTAVWARRASRAQAA